jgi:hypothetical protein
MTFFFEEELAWADMGKTKDVMQIVDPARRNKNTIESALR